MFTRAGCFTGIPILLPIGITTLSPKDLPVGINVQTGLSANWQELGGEVETSVVKNLLESARPARPIYANWQMSGYLHLSIYLSTKSGMGHPDSLNIDLWTHRIVSRGASNEDLIMKPWHKSFFFVFLFFIVQHIGQIILHLHSEYACF